MTNTLLDKISKDYQFPILTDAWANSAIGKIVDIKNDGNYRFVDYIKDEDGIVRKRYLSPEEELTCPIVATGFVGYWLGYRSHRSVRDIFESYYGIKFAEYEHIHEYDDDAWARDLKREFVCHKHINIERQNIKTSEAIFTFLTQNDVQSISKITTQYLKFVRNKRKELYPPNYPNNKVIEETFFESYRSGGAIECVNWIRDEYDLPHMGPHWYDKAKESSKPSSERKKKHEEDSQRYILEEYEDFDDYPLTHINGGMMEEIDENLKSCATREAQERYIISILTHFKDFADAFYPKSRIDKRKHAIERHNEWKVKFAAMENDTIDEDTGKPIRPKEQIAAIDETTETYYKDIEYWTEVQERFFWFAQHGLTKDFAEGENQQISTCLGTWWSLMIFFARQLAALLLTYGINLMDIQEKCGIYLMSQFLIHDYVDDYYITSIEHAQKLLDKIEATNPTSQTKNERPLDYVYDEVIKICEEFKHYIEDKQLSTLFYKKARTPDESDWQLLLYTIACTHQKASNGNYHISREDNSGCGEIDMHFTKGNEVNICLEMKRSSNGHILHGYKNQLPGYMKAENAQKGIFLIVEEDDLHKTQINQVLELNQQAISSGNAAIKVIVINARKQVPASNPSYIC